MKYSILILIMLFVGCGEKKNSKDNHVALAVDTASGRVYVRQDTVFDKVSLAIKYLDSNLYYGKMFNEYKDKQHEAELKYLSSGGEKKYERLFYKYDKLRSEAAKKANRFNDSLQSISKTKQ